MLRSSSDSLLSGPSAYPLLRPHTSSAAGGRGDSALSNSAASALQSFYVVQRALCLVQMSQVSVLRLSVCLSVSLAVCVTLSVCLSVSLTVCVVLPVRLSVCLSVSLTVQWSCLWYCPLPVCMQELWAAAGWPGGHRDRGTQR